MAINFLLSHNDCFKYSSDWFCKLSIYLISSNFSTVGLKLNFSIMTWISDMQGINHRDFHLDATISLSDTMNNH